MGTPHQQAGGCQLQELTTLYPPSGVAVSPYNDAFNAAGAAFYNTYMGAVLDPSLADAAAVWAHCMTALGYQGTTTPNALAGATVGNRPFASGTDSNGQPTASTIAETASATEVSTALDDWACETNTNFVKRWYGRLQSLTADFAQQHSQLIDNSITTWQQLVATRADTATAANPPSAWAAAVSTDESAVIQNGGLNGIDPNAGGGSDQCCGTL